MAFAFENYDVNFWDWYLVRFGDAEVVGVGRLGDDERTIALAAAQEG